MLSVSSASPAREALLEKEVDYSVHSIVYKVRARWPSRLLLGSALAELVDGIRTLRGLSWSRLGGNSWFCWRVILWLRNLTVDSGAQCALDLHWFELLLSDLDMDRSSLASLLLAYFHLHCLHPSSTHVQYYLVAMQ